MTKQEMQANLKAKVYDGPSGRSFYEDLIDTFNLDPSDPKVAKMYSLAWENGHAYGYQEVFHHFEDLVEVFKS